MQDEPAAPVARARARNLGALLGAAACLATLGCAWHFERRAIGRLEPTEILPTTGLSELSGLAWFAPHGTLLAVCDDGTVAELDLDGHVRRARRHAGNDFEDLFIGADGRTITVIEESEPAVVEISVADFEVLSRRPVEHPGWPRTSLNRGYEGACADGERILLACEDHPPAIASLAPGAGRTDRLVILDVPSPTCILPAGDGEHFVISRSRGFALLGTSGFLGGGFLPVAGDRIEGATLVPGRGLCVTSDEKRSSILVFGQIRTWDDLRAMLVERRRR
jgi:hypothetical protein